MSGRTGFSSRTTSDSLRLFPAFQAREWTLFRGRTTSTTCSRAWCRHRHRRRADRRPRRVSEAVRGRGNGRHLPSPAGGRLRGVLPGRAQPCRDGAVIVPDVPLRLHPGIAKLKEALNSGELGTFRGIRLEAVSQSDGVDLARVVFPRLVDVIRAHWVRSKGSPRRATRPAIILIRS